MNLYAIERHLWLVETTRSKGRIDVTEVAATLDVSVETVRRDLSVLESKGLLRRVHGGAVPIDLAGPDDALDQYDRSPQPDRSRVAQAALQLLGAAELIYLDDGSATQELARLLPLRDLTVVTNALPIAMMIAQRPQLHVIVLGGRVRRDSPASTDWWATRMMNDFVFDICFIETTGITPEHGLTCRDAATGAVKTAAIAASRRRILLTDSRVFGVDMTNRFANCADLHQIVTDGGADETQLNGIRALGVDVIVA